MAFEVKEYFAVRDNGTQVFLGASDDGSYIDRRVKEKANELLMPIRVYRRKGHELLDTVWPDQPEGDTD